MSTPGKSPPPKRYLGKRGKAFASLNQVLKIHLRRSADGRRVIGNATIADRSEFYSRMIRQLHEMGYELRDVHNLKPKHIDALMRLWESQELSASTLQKRFSYLRLLCRWIGKHSMLRHWSTYLEDPENYRRQYAAEYDHSWSAQGVDPQEKIAAIGADDSDVARVLKLQLAFGLRIQEASMLRPALDHQGDVLRVVAGTKGGRPRTVPIETDEQRAVLSEAHFQARRTGRSMIPPEYDLKQWLKHCYYILGRNGVSRRDGLVTHGLRHQYANDQYEQLTGESSPVRGGIDEPHSARHQLACLEVSARLGHARKRITEAYYGKADAMPATSEDARRERKRFNSELRVQQQLLAERIREQIGERANGRGQVSESTLTGRWRLLNRMLRVLALRGQPLTTPDALDRTHIDLLLGYWHRSPAISTSSARNQAQLLAQCCAWLERPELALAVRDTWRRLQAGEVSALVRPLGDAEIERRMACIREQDARVAAHLELVRVLGLTHRQAALLQPHRSWCDDHLEVFWDAPRDQVLRLAITTDRQRAILADAREQVAAPDEALCPPELRTETWIKRVYQVMREVGRIGVAGEPTLAELKDPTVPKPVALHRETWLMERSGLHRHPAKRHLFGFRA